VIEYLSFPSFETPTPLTFMLSAFGVNIFKRFLIPQYKISPVSFSILNLVSELFLNDICLFEVQLIQIQRIIKQQKIFSTMFLVYQSNIELSRD
jgi:hypothetical protein